MRISIAYADPDKPLWLELDAIERAALGARLPGFDPANHKLGVFGKLAKPDRPLNEGDRVEIYRPIICDPKTVPRRATAEDG